MSKRALTHIFLAISLLWLTGVLFSFFNRSPVDDAGIRWGALFEVIPLIFERVIWHYFIIALILISSCVIGGKIAELLKLEFNGQLEKTFIRIPLGIAAISMGTMLLGFLHVLYTPVLWLYILSPLLIWRKMLVADTRDVIDAWGTSKIGGMRLIMILLLLIFILLTFLAPLYPTTSVDAVNYALTLPKVYLDAGWFTLDPYVKYSSSPHNHTLLFTLAMGLGDEVTAVLTHYAVWVILLGAIAAFGARYLSPTGGLAGAVAFALIPVTTLTATWGNAESFFGLYTLMSFWAIYRFVKSRAAGDAILAGIFLGFMVGVKLFLGMVWLWLLVMAFVYILSTGKKFPVKNYLVIIVVSVAMLSPWFLRNVVYFGNPFFPFFNSELGNLGGIYAEYEDEIESDIHAGLKGFSPEKNEVSLLTLPTEMTFWPSWGSKPGKPGQMRFTERKELGIGPLLLGLLPLLVFVRRKWEPLVGLLILSGLCILTWFYGLHVVYIRYWSMFFPLLMAAGGFAFAEVFNFEGTSVRKPYGMALAGITSVLCIAHFINGVMPADSWKVPLKEASREAYLARNITGYKLIERLNDMPDEPKVYFLYGAPSRFYCHFFVIAGFTTPHNYDSFWQNAESGTQLHGWLSDIGITHLLVDKRTMGNQRKKLPDDDSFGRLFHQLDADDQVVLYELE